MEKRRERSQFILQAGLCAFFRLFLLQKRSPFLPSFSPTPPPSDRIEKFIFDPTDISTLPN